MSVTSSNKKTICISEETLEAAVAALAQMKINTSLCAAEAGAHGDHDTRGLYELAFLRSVNAYTELHRELMKGVQ